MSRIPFHTTNRATAHLLATIDTLGTEEKSKHYPDSTEYAQVFDSRRLKRLQPMDEVHTSRFKQAAILKEDLVTEFLDEDLIYLISGHMKRWVYLLLTDSAELLPGEPGNKLTGLRGFTKHILPGRYCSAFALSVRGRQVSQFELAATLFHELVHTADFDNLKLDFEEYRFEFERAMRRVGIDPFAELALGADKELVPRAFQASLFGSQGPVRNKRHFRFRILRWRQDFSPVVRLVERDCYTLFSEVRNELEERRSVMTLEQQTVRPVRRRDMEGDIIACYEYPEEGFDYDSVQRGILLWLREQAHRAEIDPDREWDGFEAEWDQLLAGTHPDPRPDLIIYGKEVDGFVPSELNVPMSALKHLDYVAYTDFKRERNSPGFDYPAWSQQLFAAYCGKSLDLLLKFVKPVSFGLKN